MSSDPESLQLWKEKLEFLRKQEAIVAAGSQKFQLIKEIEEAEAKIRELSARREKD